MRLIPSLILYNPLEAALLLWCSWLLRDEKYRNLKFNKKRFIINSYILGIILLFIQYPLSLINNTLIFIIYDKILSFLIGPLIHFIYYKKCNLLKTFTIQYGYIISLNFIVKRLGFPFALTNSIFDEFKANIYIKAIQFCIVIIILFGGIIMKKLLVKIAKKNVANTIAPTYEGYGEQKLSIKLQDEVKR